MATGMSDLDRITRKSLGEILVDEGLLSVEQLRQVTSEQERTGEPLAEAVVRAGYVSEESIAKTLCEQLSKPFCKATGYDIAPDVIKLFPPRLLVEHCFVPLDRFGDLLILAMGGLLDQMTLTQIRRLSGCKVEVFVSTATDVKQVLRRQFPDLYDPITMQPVFEEKEYTTNFRLEMSDGMGEDDDDMGGSTREIVGVADEDSDWEALFEEAERNVLNERQSQTGPIPNVPKSAGPNPPGSGLNGGGRRS